MATAVSFCLVTFLSSIVATHLPNIFYGAGIWTGSFVGWTVAYFRLRWIDKHVDEHMFCRGRIINRGKGIKPSGKVFDAYEPKEEAGEEAK